MNQMTRGNENNQAVSEVSSVIDLLTFSYRRDASDSSHSK